MTRFELMVMTCTVMGAGMWAGIYIIIHSL